MIQAKNIHKFYDDLHVLKGVDVSIASKEIVSIVGASGAGKTTLLQILGTLDRADSTAALAKRGIQAQPSLLINDTLVTELNDKQMSAFRNRHIGFIFQFHQLLPEFTALENICIPGMIAGKSMKELESRAMELLGFLNLKHRASHKPSAMSGGEQQRVAVARALINEPAVVLADEPSGNLDSHSADELHKLFFTLREEFGQTFVIVTHNNELADMADRKLVMSDGLFLP